ncbi:unnamed protein product [Candidula unifasciata]|uniref:XK-related protein n=1 Tax=Candidula unifasciata TaxID=100452 RepID=A0A8S3ZMH9_9EUPU|nr:unnamed protein product [Candidula unifasciata]
MIYLFPLLLRVSINTCELKYLTVFLGVLPNTPLLKLYLLRFPIFINQTKYFCKLICRYWCVYSSVSEWQTVWGSLVAVFVSLSAVLTSVVGAVWHVRDKTATPVIIVSHLLLAAPVERFCAHKKALRALSDVSVLRLIEAFLQSAPQLVLQMYIILCEKRICWITGFSVACSLLSLTWAVTAYCDTQCSAHSSSHCRHIVRLLLHWGWQLFMTAARISAFVLFACVLGGWMFAVMGAHWLVAFVWISVRGTDYGRGHERWLFRLVCAFIYIFVFLNLNKGKSRWRIAAYYLLTLLENKGMLAVFLVMGGSSMILLPCLVVIAGFFLGLACMLMYYAFFHPSGSIKRVTRLFLPHLTSSSISRSTAREETDLQIFSVESPKTLSLVESASSQISFNASILPVASTSIHISHLDETNSFRKTNSFVNLSQKTLQMVWQSGMESSSGSSSSSIVSTENRSGLIKRSSSFQSDKSHGSAASDSSLLPPLSERNSLSKSPQRNFDLAAAELDSLKREQAQDTSESDNVNNFSGRSKSPTLSKDSWSRLSDQNIKPLIMGDFSLLGFDESSSTEKRVSDSSSFSSQAKSLSLLDVSNLWKDVHVRIRATIAATVAAAMGNSSSIEGASVRNQSVSSSNSAALSQEDSLNSTHSVSVYSHDTAFMDSNSSYKESLNISQQNNLQRFSQHQESQSALAEIFESFGREELSDDETRDHTNEIKKTNTTQIPALAAMNCSSPFNLDSTLTVSKLEVQKSKSYLASQRKNDSVTDQQISCPVVYSYRSPVQNSLNVANSGSTEACKGDSPFTDQELVALMAKSLRNYVEGNSSFDSNQPEREGLALTLEDLRVSREGSPETSPLSHKIKGSWKSQSGSSMIRNSEDSSPASSASKMNRVISVKKAEAKLSPNAFKQIEDLPQRLQSLEDLEDNEVAVVPHSDALKFIMDSYGSSAVTDLSVNTPVSQKSFFQTPLSGLNPKSRSGTKLHQQLLPYSNRDTSNIPVSPRGRGKNTIQRQVYNTNHQDVDKANHSKVHGGVSSTKKLNVHFSGASQMENKKSCEQAKHGRGSSSASDGEGYVSGMYCPPLCAGETDSEQNYIQKNLDRDHLKYDLNRVSKCFLGAPATTDKKHTVQAGDRELFNHQRRETNIRDPHFYKQRSDLLTLQQMKPVPHKPQPSKPHPYQHTHSPSRQLSGENGVQKTSNAVDKPGRTTCVWSHAVDELSDNELHLSVEHVAEYFSEALDVNSIDTHSGARPKVHCPQAQRQVPGFRQPLQRLENSQHLSPEANSFRLGNRQGNDSLPYRQIQNQRHAETSTVNSPDILHQRYELHRKHQTHHIKDIPRTRLQFESDQSARLASRPPLVEPKRLTPGSSINLSDKSSSKVRFSLTQDRDIPPNRIIHKTKGLSRNQ